ncbi:hypothetical protein BOTBODRAFT_143420 [Botryobasidium botryosum FD-172 SS1]|uniref:Uncharacterized protein n=1 Tax=Botryobasidium botryosum (strain FD-172 SS1) TaxID=930990 RepID=A0A067MS25_BOTB1|nr:hypothetical protein BOTBODRAFT_143420 [Botryobasidium botryosum FD-172 SS1]
MALFFHRTLFSTVSSTSTLSRCPARPRRLIACPATLSEQTAWQVDASLVNLPAAHLAHDHHGSAQSDSKKRRSHVDLSPLSQTKRTQQNTENKRRERERKKSGMAHPRSDLTPEEKKARSDELRRLRQNKRNARIREEKRRAKEHAQAQENPSGVVPLTMMPYTEMEWRRDMGPSSSSASMAGSWRAEETLNRRHVDHSDGGVSSRSLVTANQSIPRPAHRHSPYPEKWPGPRPPSPQFPLRLLPSTPTTSESPSASGSRPSVSPSPFSMSTSSSYRQNPSVHDAGDETPREPNPPTPARAGYPHNILNSAEPSPAPPHSRRDSWSLPQPIIEKKPSVSPFHHPQHHPAPPPAPGPSRSGTAARGPTMSDQGDRPPSVDASSPLRSPSSQGMHGADQHERPNVPVPPPNNQERIALPPINAGGWSPRWNNSPSPLLRSWHSASARHFPLFELGEHVIRRVAPLLGKCPSLALHDAFEHPDTRIFERLHHPMLSHLIADHEHSWRTSPLSVRYMGTIGESIPNADPRDFAYWQAVGSSCWSSERRVPALYAARFPITIDGIGSLGPHIPNTLRAYVVGRRVHGAMALATGTASPFAGSMFHRGLVTDVSSAPSGTSQIFVALEGRQVWLTWPVTPKNSAWRTTRERNDVRAEVSLGRALDELESLHVTILEAGQWLLLRGGTLYATLSLDACGHMVCPVVDMRKVQETEGEMIWEQKLMRDLGGSKAREIDQMQREILGEWEEATDVLTARDEDKRTHVWDMVMRVRGGLNWTRRELQREGRWGV